jgi:hypothetical protein
MKIFHFNGENILENNISSWVSRYTRESFLKDHFSLCCVSSFLAPDHLHAFARYMRIENHAAK